MTCPIPAVSLYQDLTFVRRDLLVERDLRFPAQAPWTGLRPSSWGSRICLQGLSLKHHCLAWLKFSFNRFNPGFQCYPTTAETATWAHDPQPHFQYHAACCNQSFFHKLNAFITWCAMMRHDEPWCSCSSQRFSLFLPWLSCISWSGAHSRDSRAPWRRFRCLANLSASKQLSSRLIDAHRVLVCFSSIQRYQGKIFVPACHRLDCVTGFVTISAFLQCTFGVNCMIV